MTSFRDDELATMLRELRPAPSAEFAAELDARAEAGFPRRAVAGASTHERVFARLRSIPPRRALPAAGGVAVAAVVIATAVLAGSGNGAHDAVSVATEHSFANGAPSAPATGTADRAHGGRSPVPVHSAAAGESNTAGPGGEEFVEGEVGSSAESAPKLASPRSGPYASHHSGRDIERGASITLADDPSRVRSDAARVFEAVHATNGIVLNSAIRDGASGEAGASFELLIPTAKLGDAMASFAGIADVRGRHEATRDITAGTVGVGEKLGDSAARVRGLLIQLEEAGTDPARTAVEIQLRGERARMANLRSRLAGLRRRANLSHVSLRIETGDSSQGASGAWGIGDGLDDAGRILAVAAGVSVIGLAALAPLALLALLPWLARRAYLARARARALA
jgi:hypothetical protein